MSLLVTCPQCGTNWPVPCLRDQAHAQCPGCRAIYVVTMKQIQQGEAVGRLVQPSRLVPVKG